MNVLFAQTNFCMGNFHLSVINQFSKKGSDNPTNIVVYNVYIWVTYGSMQTFLVKKDIKGQLWRFWYFMHNAEKLNLLLQ